MRTCEATDIQVITDFVCPYATDIDMALPERAWGGRPINGGFFACYEP